MTLIACDKCKARGSIRGLGMIETKCSKCLGVRFVSDELPQYEKTTVNIELNDVLTRSDVSHNTDTVIPKRRGRPPRIEE